MRHKLAVDAPWPGHVKLKVTSDGTAEGTRVLAVDSAGAEYLVEGVTSVAWRIDITYGDPLATATIAFLATAGELETERAPEIVPESPELDLDPAEFQ